MAEKPKLKDTGEILDSIGKSKKQPAMPPAQQQEEAQEAAGGTVPEAPQAGERVEDRNPLDIGKYDLKAAGAAKPRRRGRPPKVRPVEEQEHTQPDPADVQEYQFEDFTPEEERQPAQEAQEAETQQVAPEGAAQLRRGRGRPRKNPLPVAEEEPTTKRKRGRPRKYPLPEQAAAAEPQEQEPPAPPPEPPESLLEERDPDAFRKDFREMLANRFDQEFTERFKGKPAAKKPRTSLREELWFEPEAIKPEPQEESWFEPKPKGKGEAILPPDEDQAVTRETEEFINEFERKILQEEEQKAASFKDTLAEKFMRERDRYLRDLGIPDEEERELLQQEQPGGPEEDVFPSVSSPEPAHRRLDFQIQPEMHMQDGELPPAPPPPLNPVTYGPGGSVRDLREEVEQPFQAAPPTRPERQLVSPFQVPPPAPSKKSSEDLLMELAHQNALRQAAGAKRQAQPRKKKKKSVGSYFSQKLQDAVPEESGEQGGGKKKMAVIAAAAAVVVLAAALVFSPIAGIVAGLGKNSGNESGYDEATGLVLSEDTLTVYESRNPDEIIDVGDVLIKKSGISMRNYNVANHVVIGDMKNEGEITLQDMTVGGTIYVRSCGVNVLRLDNVTADRVVVNNLEQKVEVQVMGDTRVSTVEVKTPAAVKQAELPQDADGVVNILASKADEVAVLNFELDGLQLRSLTANDSAILELSGGTSIELVSTEGPTWISGDGRVLSLSASGGKDDAERTMVNLQDISVTTMSVAGAAHLNLGGTVNMLTVSENLYVEGSGTISMLMVQNEGRVDRLSVELLGVGVNTLIADTEAIVQSTGDSRIAELHANQSVYTVGNKVGHLMVNANNVIYENKPDKITTSSGVRPPETLADNPNLDLTLATVQNDSPLDVSGDDLATTCDHTRERGGYLVGDGSVSNPFQVSTPAQLAHVSAHLDSHFVQTADIDIGEDSTFASGFTPIANEGTPFTGSYDGMGYRISGLRISSGGENVGLFAENVGTIRNVHIASGEIEATASGRAYVGGIAGIHFKDGLIENCSNGARITGASSGNAGGIAGYNYGARIRDCYNFAKVSGSGTVGGITGANRDEGSIVGSYNVGTIEDGAESGSIAGVNTNGTIANCYYLADTAEFGIGDGGGSVEQRTSSQMADAQMARDLAAGDPDTLWTMPTSGSYDYPILAPPSRDGLEAGEDYRTVAPTSAEVDLDGPPIPEEPEPEPDL